MQGDELGRGVVVGVGIGVVLPLGRVGDAPARGMDPKARALDEHVVAAAIDLAEAVVAPVLAPAVPDFPVGNGGAVVGDVDAPADHLDDVVGVPLGAVALGFFDDADADVGHHGVRGDVARDGARARDLGHDGARRRERPDVGGGGQPTKVLDADARVRRRRADEVARARVRVDAVGGHGPARVLVVLGPRRARRGHAVAADVLGRAVHRVGRLVGHAAREGHAAEALRPAPHARGRAARDTAAVRVAAAVEVRLVRRHRVGAVPRVGQAAPREEIARDLDLVVEHVVRAKQEAAAAVHGHVLVLRRREDAPRAVDAPPRERRR
mmetsp:Transcript_23965/g.95099  ORF Transcript_23965/g.95099 Transcript_23965/m.95099 type:complete len:324 (+) Transcript_23965:391-1362(+)